MKISKEADISGINPADLIGKEEEYTITAPEEEDDCLTAEDREARNGGTFTQYTLHLLDGSDDKKRLSYLFERHLVPLAKAHGEDSTNWIGQKVIVTGKMDGKYANPVLKPIA